MTYNEEYDRILENWVKNYPLSYFKKIKAKDNKFLLDYVNECTPLLQNDKYLISTKVFWVINHIQNFPKCKICGKEITKNIKVTEGYPSHCSAKCLSDDPDIQHSKEISYQKRYGEGITNPFSSKEVHEQINRTNYKKYGVKRFTQSKFFKDIVESRHDEIEKMKYLTHKKNNSFNISKVESIVYELLVKKFKEVKTQYQSEKYPFKCDFYVPSEDLYIEYNGTWTHGEHSFDGNNENDLKIIEKWKSYNNRYYNNAVYVWSDLDVRKRTTARDNNLNFIEFWDIKEVYNYVFPNIDKPFITDNLELMYNRKRIEREFKYYQSEETEILNPYISKRNEIVKFFQQNVFFGMEKEIWKNDLNKRQKLIENRCRFLEKNADELDVNDLLTGFKKSGIYYGYSHFNPLWFKWFIHKYNSKICYDPCGGWGHRLLGASNLEKYIYNDFSKTTKDNVDKIIGFFNIKNTETHNNDARFFIPFDNFDTMFTCPPYFNIEHYECGDFKDKNDFNDFIDSLFEVFEKKESCKTLGIVIREDLIGSKHQNYTEKHEVNKRHDRYLDDKIVKYREFLYIFRK